VNTLSAIGAVPNANGASITGTTLTLQVANGGFGGVLTSGAQTITGDKTFAGTTVFNSSTSGTVSLNSTVATNQTSVLFQNSGSSRWQLGNQGSGSNYDFFLWDGAASTNSINIGSNNGLFTLGNAARPLQVISSGLNVSTAGALTGVTGITTNGAYTQTSTGTNTFSGVSNFTAAGTALAVTNNATVGGTLGVTGAVTGSSTIQGTRLISTVSTGTAPLTVTSTTRVDNLNVQYLDGFTGPALAESLRANNNLSGGGTIAWDGANLNWTSRMIVIANGNNGTDFAGSGYFDIDMPAVSTVITGVGGASNATVVAGGIPLASWTALYYILPRGAGNTTLNANFRVATYTSALDVPADWVLIAVNNSDNNSLRLGIGHTLRAGQSVTQGTINNPTFNTSVTVGAGGIITSGGYAQSGSGANTLTGATTVSAALNATAAGTGLAVTNDATIGGKVSVGSYSYYSSAYSGAAGWKFSVAGGGTYFDGTNFITPNVGANAVSAVAADLNGVAFYTQASSGASTRTDSPATFNSYERFRITNTGDLLQTGTGAFTTASGAITLNGNTSISGTKTLTVGTGATALGGTLGVNGNTTLGSAAGVGLLTNNGATLNSTLALTNFAANAPIGTAAATVDIYTSVSVLQTTGSIVLTIPTPTTSPTTVFGRVLYLSNIGTASFVVSGATISPGTTATLIWSNTDGAATGAESWQFAGADGNGILNQVSVVQAANFRINGTGQAAGFDGLAGGTLALGGTNATGVTIGNTTNATALTLQGTTGAVYAIGNNLVGGSISIGGTGAQTGSISLGTGTGAQSIDLGTGGTGAKTVTLGSIASTSSLALQSGTNGVSVNVAGTQQAIFGGSNTLYLGNASTAGLAAAPNAFTLSTTSSSAATVAGAAFNINSGAGNTTGAGGLLTVKSGNGGASGAGGGLVLQAGNGGGTTGGGGQVTIQGGNASVAAQFGGDINLAGGTGGAFTGGSGVAGALTGVVFIDTPVFTATTFSTGALTSNGQSFAVPQLDIDGNSTEIVTVGTGGANCTAFNGAILTLGAPTRSIQGRVFYVSSGPTSCDFVLTPAGSSSIAMKPNSTATMVWNGTAWTAAGASASTTLQAAYDNTLASAGGAEILLKDVSVGGTGGLTIRNSSTSSITGALLEIQTAIGSNLLSANNNTTEYSTNGGAETAGGTNTTFLAGSWTAAPAGGAVSRYITPGTFISTGSASVFADTTAVANTGIKNTLSTTLTTNLRYKVSYTVRHNENTTALFNTLDTIYSSDGTATTQTCSSASVATTSAWTRVDCSFTATAVSATNAIIIRHSDAVEHDFYVDNLSVTVSADVNHAADGSADTAANIGIGTLNWAAVNGSTVTQSTTVLYDSAGAVSVATAATATRGVYNKLSNNIAPSLNTLYRVAFYARGDGTNGLSSLVTYTPDNGTTTVNCKDYNTQAIAANAYTLVSCTINTGPTAITNAQIRITQTAGAATTFFVDALTVTLSNNNSNNVQIGGGNNGGPTTLFTLDRSAGAPIAANNDAYLGSMYYDTITGRIQCYEADGWGACGAAPDNIVNLNPEYAGAVLNGGPTPGVGTMTSDFCGSGGGLAINDGSSGQPTLCTAGQAKNLYKWTSPQATLQTYSIYVTYQLPATFNGFSDDNTIQLVARTDSLANAAVTYEVFKSTGSTVSACGTATTVVTTANTWQSVGINGNEATGCGFNSSSAGNFVIFKINMKANSNANAYVSTLSFVTTGR
jgi:hypothetical protein